MNSYYIPKWTVPEHTVQAVAYTRSREPHKDVKLLANEYPKSESQWDFDY